jgi:hypothetical protein
MPRYPNFMKTITTCSFFRLDNFQNKWWAFKQMQLGHIALKNTTGLNFHKILGSGAKNGFSAIPNFGTYVLLCVWDSEDEAKSFFTSHPFFLEYKSRSIEQFTAYLDAAESHGFWDGVQPFDKTAALERNKPVVVLTRARIRLNKLWSFWTKVGTVSQSLENYDGLIFSIGIGEWPLIQQATISIWRTHAEMIDYAYKDKKHKEVVQLTRKLKWYKEELFARFVPYRFDGSWNGNKAKDLL